MVAVAGGDEVVDFKLTPIWTVDGLVRVTDRLRSLEQCGNIPAEAVDAVVVDGRPMLARLAAGRAVRPTSGRRLQATVRFVSSDPVLGPTLAAMRTEALIAALAAQMDTTVRRASLPPVAQLTVKPKSKRGRKHREAGLDCEAQMLVVLEKNPHARVFSGRQWEALLKKRFGDENGFGRRTIEKTDLYRLELRPAVRQAVKDYGESFIKDFLNHGLNLWTDKPGRGDKRKDWTEKQNLAAKQFLGKCETAEFAAKRRVALRGEDEGKPAGQ